MPSPPRGGGKTGSAGAKNQAIPREKDVRKNMFQREQRLPQERGGGAGKKTTGEKGKKRTKKSTKQGTRNKEKTKKQHYLSATPGGAFTTRKKGGTEIGGRPPVKQKMEGGKGADPKKTCQLTSGGRGEGGGMFGAFKKCDG